MTASVAMYIIVMAGVTYLVRMLPFVIFRKRCYSRPVFFFPLRAIIFTAKEVGGSDCTAHPITGTEKEIRGGTDLASLL